MNLRDRTSTPRRADRGASGPSPDQAGSDARGGARQNQGNAGMAAPASPNSADVPTDPPPMQVLRGLAVSPGIAIGPVVVLDARGLRLPPRKVAPEAVGAELSRL